MSFHRGAPMPFFGDHPPVSLIVSFRRSTEVSTYLFYRSHKYFLPSHSFFFCNTHVSLSYNNVGTNTALCTVKRAAVLTFRRLINAAKVPLILLPAAAALTHLSHIFHLYLTYFPNIPFHPLVVISYHLY